MTNLIVLSIALVTNQQSAIVGYAGNKALVASQEIVVQQTDLGYIKKCKPIKLFEINKAVSSKVTTNAVPIVFTPPAPSTNAPALQPPPSPVPPPAIPSQTDAPNVDATRAGTNSPAYKRRPEREQRMRPSTNTPAIK